MALTILQGLCLRCGHAAIERWGGIFRCLACRESVPEWFVERNEPSE